MKDRSVKEAIQWASSYFGPISIIATRCIEGEALSSEKLEQELINEQYKINYAPKERGCWAKVYRDDKLVAQGYSVDKYEALQQAVYGAVREEYAHEVVARTLAQEGVQVTPELHQTLESRFITDGGMTRLKEDMKQFKHGTI